MKLLSRPKVYLVTRPTVDWDQVAAFLGDEDLPPVPDSIRAGSDESSAIIEISARLCYMSFWTRQARHHGLHKQPAVLQGRQCVRARELRVRLHRGLPQPHPRTGQTPRGIRLQPALTAICGRDRGRVRASSGAGLGKRRCHPGGRSPDLGGRAEDRRRQLHGPGRGASVCAPPGEVRAHHRPSQGHQAGRPPRCCRTPPRPRFSLPQTSARGATSSRCAGPPMRIGRSGRWPWQCWRYCRRRPRCCSATSPYRTCRTARRSRSPSTLRYNRLMEYEACRGAKPHCRESSILNVDVTDR